MKKHGHYCKICGEYKANEKFSGKGHAAHICKACAALPLEERTERMAVNRLLNLPWRLSKEQLAWLKNRMKDKTRKCVCWRKNNMNSDFHRFIWNWRKTKMIGTFLMRTNEWNDWGSLATQMTKAILPESFMSRGIIVM